MLKYISNVILLPLLLTIFRYECISAKVVTFTGGNYSGYQTWNWTAITHLAFWTKPPSEVMTLAKKNDVRLYLDSHLIDQKQWTNETARKEFAAYTYDRVKENSFDGVFFDYEGNSLTKDEKSAFAMLAQEVTNTLRPINGSIFVCVAGRPDYEWRDYPYKDLAAASEFLFIMGYDMHFWDDYTCITKGTCSPAEASLKDLKLGLSEYLKVVDPSKLVLGLPWYGQHYFDLVVPINVGQVDYKDVLKAMDTKNLIKTKTIDQDSQSWVLKCNSNCIEGQKFGKTVWFDDATTLTPKYQLASDNNLLGVGMWSVDKLPIPEADGSDPHKNERDAMWTAISNWETSMKLVEKYEDNHIHQKIPTSASASVVNVIQSSEDSKSRLVQLPAIQFVNQPSKKAKYTIQVNESLTKQSVRGFGGAITDSVANVFYSLNSELQKKVLNLLWGEQSYNLARLTIGSTDFSTGVYNYNEPTGKRAAKPDFDQETFSIDHDKTQIIPLIKLVQNITNGNIDFLSSPWSPPGWMKRPYLALKGHMRNSAKPGMIQDNRMFKSYALYLSKYLTAYKSMGVNISMMTIQNEPDSADHMFPVAYPACNFNGTEEGSFLRDFLGPQLKKDHPEMKIFVHDGQKFHDVPILNRVEAILKATEGMVSQVSGVAFHWYGNNLKNYQYLQELHEKHPELELLGTEATLEAPSRQTFGTTPWKEARKYAIDILGDLNAGASGWIEWNVLLDQNGGPTCIGSTGGEDCTPLIGHCDAPILADAKKQTIEIRDSYYFVAHFSRFIKKKSKILHLNDDVTNTNTTFMSTAAVTPDGNLVVVVLNTDDKSEITYQLEWNNQYAEITVPPSSIQTLTVVRK
jgi:glucosylceramidase